MADDVAQLADSLAKTQVVEGELSYKGKGLKLDNAESGELGKCSKKLVSVYCNGSIFHGQINQIELKSYAEISACDSSRHFC